MRLSILSSSDRPAHRVFKEFKARKETRVIRATKVIADRLALLVVSVLLVVLALLVLPVLTVFLLLPSRLQAQLLKAITNRVLGQTTKEVSK
jgi:hypothetical protein